MLCEINGTFTLIRKEVGGAYHCAVKGDRAAQTSVFIKLRCHPSAKVENGVESGSASELPARLPS